MKKTILLFAALGFLTLKNQAQTVTDIDGNIYNPVTIGTQVWLQENLKTTRYNNGNFIGTTTPATFDIRPESTPKYQWAYEGSENKADTFGRLYTWYAATDSRGLCPVGWHVPADVEWTTLSAFLGGTSVAGGKMKATGTIENGDGLWYVPNQYATNSSGFTALPSGFREDQGIFKEIGYNCYWWSSTELYQTSAWSRGLAHDDGVLNGGVNYKKSGLSVRCVKDSTTQINEFNNPDNFRIYPNPATDFFTIECGNIPYLNLTIFNVAGQIMLRKELSKNKNDINISAFSKGIFIIKVSVTDRSAKIKLIKN